MIHTKLRLTAAWFTLGLVKTSDLVDVAHTVLDQSVYADGFAAMVSVRNLPHEEATSHFAAALRSLGIAFATQDDAVWYLRLIHLGPVAEEMVDPHVGLGQHADELHDLEHYGALAALSGWSEPPAAALPDHLIVRWHLLAEAEREMDPLAPGETLLKWNHRAVRLCREWCREYGRLYLQPAWRSPTVVSFASAIHADRAFDRLPILADALEEAGCDHPDLLAHCRRASPHADYCWLVDLLLDKA